MSETLTTTTHRVQSIIEMFADNTSGETYHRGRLVTREMASGNVALIGYGWMKLAEYDESENHVTVFFGHKSTESKTVSRWLNRILEQTSDRRNVSISDESPVVGKPNDGVRYIGEYVGDFTNLSPVDRGAIEFVENSLDFL